jgi:hypothetical protein
VTKSARHAELDGRRNDVQRQRGPDAETGVAAIDGEPAE